MTVGWYEFRYVCPDCGAVHYYKPRNGCQNCDRLTLKKEPNRQVKMTEEHVELKLGIDRNRLDDEWVDHPAMYHYWACHAAEAQIRYDETKSKLDLIKAELDDDIRTDPQAYGVKKVTEKAIENAILIQPSYKSVLKKMHQARHDLEIARANLNSLEHKKRALSLLTELWIRDYYSDPAIRPLTEDGENFAKQTVRSRGRRRMERDHEDGEDE